MVLKVTKSDWGAGKGSHLELLMRKHHLQKQALAQAHQNRWGVVVTVLLLPLPCL